MIHLSKNFVYLIVSHQRGDCSAQSIKTVKRKIKPRFKVVLLE